MMSLFSAVRGILVSLAAFKLCETLSLKSVTILSESGSSDYVLLGQSANITCQYTLDPDEVVEGLSWYKDRELVYRWYPYRQPSFVKEGFGRTTQITPHTLNIPEVHLEMHGRYTCYVETNSQTGAEDKKLIVIVDACSDNSLETQTQILSNTVSLEMNCVGMFPDPRYSIEMYSGITLEQVYSRTLPFDEVIPLPNGTYEIKENTDFTIKCATKPTIIRCYMTVPGTSWSRIISNLIMKDGCDEPPHDVQFGTYSMSEGLSCWGNPKEGTTVKYYCDEGYSLQGPSELMCNDSFWVPSGQLNHEDHIWPLCVEDHPVCSQEPPMLHQPGYIITNATRSLFNKWPEGSIIEYRCEDGYQLQGPSKWECYNDTWVTTEVIPDGDLLVPVCVEVNASVAVHPKTALFVALMTISLFLRRTLVLL